MTTKSEINVAECRHCGHEFIPRVPNPQKCTICYRPWPLGEKE